MFDPTTQKLVCGACGGAFAMRDTPYEQQGSLDDLHGVFRKIDEE